MSVSGIETVKQEDNQLIGYMPKRMFLNKFEPQLALLGQHILFDFWHHLELLYIRVVYQHNAILEMSKCQENGFGNKKNMEAKKGPFWAEYFSLLKPPESANK